MIFSSLIHDFQVLLLMSVRILVLLSLTPIISASQTPFLVRIVLAAAVAYIIKHIIGLSPFQTPANISEFIVLLSVEVLIGAIIGFYIRMIFLLLGSISEFFTTLMGLRAAQVLNPLTGVQTVILTQFISLVVMVVFISSYTLQKIFYYGITQSFMVINAQSVFQTQNKSLLMFIFFAFVQLFERAFIIALPMFISLLIVNIGLGLYGKVAPQMNLLVLGLPLQVGLGVLLLLLFLPILVASFESSFDNMIHNISNFILNLKPVTGL